MRPINNFNIVVEYLKTGHNTTHTAYRCIQFMKDLGTIKAMCELGDWKG